MVHAHKKTIIAYVAGKSGGHIIPCITRISAENNHHHEYLFFTTRAASDTQLISSLTYPVNHYPLAFGTRSYAKKTNILTQAASFITSFFISFFYLIKKRPSCVRSTGGAVSIPVCLAAWIMRIPIELFEFNASPGKAVRFLSPYATTILVCFPSARPFFPTYKTQIKAYPLRTALLHGDKAHSTEKKTILIVGGSQGSRGLNNLFLAWLDRNPDLHTAISIIHQVGNTADAVHSFKHHYNQLSVPASVFDFNPQLPLLYGKASLIITRAGAGTLWEIAHCKKKSIVIPLLMPYNNHQQDNAVAIQMHYPDLFSVIAEKDAHDNPGLLNGLIRSYLL